MSILSQLFSNYGDDLARQFVDHADDAVLAGIRNYGDDTLRAAANQSDDMIKLYRGISAENEDLLNQYVDEMFDPNIKPTTHSGGSAYGEGYYFTPSKDLAEYYAHKNGDPYYAIASVEVPKKKFTRISAELANRPADFDLAAIKRGVPENIRYQTGINDFNNYIDDNGFWGTLSNGENPNYIVMRNDALKNMGIIDGNYNKNLLNKLTKDDGITPIYRGQKYGVNDLLYNKNGGGAAGAGTSPSVSNAYYFTPNSGKAGNWASENGGTIKIPMRDDDVITLQQLQDMIAEADPIFADPRKSLDLYNTNPTKYDLMEAVADRQYRTISELTKKPFIQPDSGQGEELMETLFFPDTNPTLTDIYRELLHRSGGKTN